MKNIFAFQIKKIILYALIISLSVFFVSCGVYIVFFYNDNGTTPFQSPHNPTEAEFLAVEKLSDLPVLDSEYDLISEEIEEALLDINDWDKLSNNPNVVVKELYVIHNFNKAVVRYYVGNLIQGEFYVRSMISMSFMPNRIFLEKIDGRWEIIRTWEPA